MSDAKQLIAIREIAHAFLVADRPDEVQQFALDRITPLIGASFSLVLKLGPDGALLRPVAQHEWPAPYRHWIGALRVRVGDGPSGRAVAERRLVEVVDIMTDDHVTEWREVASELGFRSIMAAPLDTTDGPLGAVVFYFRDATSLTDEQRALVQLVADQLAAVTDKARHVDAVRRANAALADANAELEAQSAAWMAARRAWDEAEALVVQALLALTDAQDPRDPVQRLAAVHALASAARDHAQLLRSAHPGEAEDVDPRDIVQDAVQRWRSRAPIVPVSVEEPTVLLPTMRTDRIRLTRTVELALGLGICGGAIDGGAVTVRLALDRGFLVVAVRWRGRALWEPQSDAPEDQLPAGSSRILRVYPEALQWEAGDPYAVPRSAVTALDLPLARLLASRLGGELRLGDPHELTLIFPVESIRR